MDDQVSWLQSAAKRKGTYLLDMVREHFGNRKAMVGILSRNIGQSGDLNARIHGQVLQGLPVIVGHVGRVVCHDGWIDFSCREQTLIVMITGT